MVYEELLSEVYAARGYLVGCYPIRDSDPPFVGRIYPSGGITFNGETICKPFRCVAVTDVEDMLAQRKITDHEHIAATTDEFFGCGFFRFETD